MRTMPRPYRLLAIPFVGLLVAAMLACASDPVGTATMESQAAGTADEPAEAVSTPPQTITPTPTPTPAKATAAVSPAPTTQARPTRTRQMSLPTPSPTPVEADPTPDMSQLQLPPFSDEKEWEALVAFYFATGGPNWHRNDGWLSDKPITQWHGVGKDGLKVDALVLPNNNLRGVLPSQLGDLSHLRGLHLSNNELTGELPQELSRLGQLAVVDIKGNKLTGCVPRLLRESVYSRDRNGSSTSEGWRRVQAPSWPRQRRPRKPWQAAPRHPGQRQPRRPRRASSH